MEWILLVMGLGTLYLMTKRWFWLLAFGLATLASVFTVLASIIHFQILAAVGFTILSVILWGATMFVLAGYD